MEKEKPESKKEKNYYTVASRHKVFIKNGKDGQTNYKYRFQIPDMYVMTKDLLNVLLCDVGKSKI